MSQIRIYGVYIPIKLYFISVRVHIILLDQTLNPFDA